jgi:predicted transcriptional regulator
MEVLDYIRENKVFKQRYIADELCISHALLSQYLNYWKPIPKFREKELELIMSNYGYTK